MEEYTPKKVVLVGVAGSYNDFCLSLYNLKAYAYLDPLIRKVWDISVIQYPLIHHFDYDEQLKVHTNQIFADAPDFVAFSCYMWNIRYFQMLAKNLKQQCPKLRIICGGPEISRDYILEGNFDDFAIDFCISGEGELTFLELLKSFTIGDVELSSIQGLSYRETLEQSFSVNEKRPPFRSLLEIPSPYLTGIVDDSVLFRDNISVDLETQRGCNLRCSYCIYHKDMSKIAYSEIDRIVDEVRYAINKGAKNIRFVDANFGSDLVHAKSILRKLIKNQFETKLFFELIPGFIDEELAQLFHEFNSLYSWNDVTLGVGVQTINMKVLKKIRRSIKLEKFEKTFALFQKYNIYAKIDLIIGLPGEDISSIETTLEYMMEKLRGSHNHQLCFHLMRGLPGTELLEQAKEYDMVFTSELEPHELYESSTLSRKELVQCLRRTAVVFRLVNHSGWTSYELISGEHSNATNIRDRFYEIRDALEVSNIGLIDLLIEGFMERLDESSYFVQERFPYAETWWWNLCKKEISDQMLLENLESRVPV